LRDVIHPAAAAWVRRCCCRTNGGTAGVWELDRAWYVTGQRRTIMGSAMGNW